MGNNSGNMGYGGPQSQGGISHEVAQAARKDPHAERAGLPDGAIGQQPYTPQSDGSLDVGDDGRAPSGFSGDDGGYDPGAAAGSPESPRNAAREGGEGGLGGTGDARPHHGVDDRSGRDASLDAEDEQPEPPDAQGGGTRQDREQRVGERKNAESGAGASRKQPDGRAAPAPGAAIDPASKR